MLDKILSLLDATPAQAVIWVSYAVSTLVGGWGTISRVRSRRTRQQTRTVENAVTELIKTHPFHLCTFCCWDGLPSDYIVTIHDNELVMVVCPQFQELQKYRVCSVNLYGTMPLKLDTTAQNQLCEILDQRYLEYKLKKEA